MPTTLNRTQIQIKNPTTGNWDDLGVLGADIDHVRQVIASIDEDQVAYKDMIANSQTTMTATREYSKNDYIAIDTKLYQVTANSITIGATLSVGTNIKEVKLAESAAENAGDIADIKEQLIDNNSVEIVALQSHSNKTQSNITFTWTGDNRVHVEGTASSQATIQLFGTTIGFPKWAVPGHTYKLKLTFNPEQSGLTFQSRYMLNGKRIDWEEGSNGEYDIEIPADATGWYCRINVTSGKTINSDVDFYIYSMFTSADAESHLRNIIAPEFSESATYKTGDCVFRNGKLYRFLLYHAAGAWNSTQVNQIKAAPTADAFFPYEQIRGAAARNAISAFADIPDGRYIVATGSVIESWVPVITLPLSNSYSYIVEAHGYTDRKFFEIYNTTGNTHYIGFEISDEPEEGQPRDIAWSDISYGNILSLPYITPAEKAGIVSVTDIPTGRYLYANGSQICDGEGNGLIPLFPYDLGQANGYTVSARYISNGYQYEVMNLNGTQRYIAYKANSTDLDNVSWQDVSPIHMRENARVIADNRAAFMFYSDFEELDGWYTTAKGTLDSDTTHKHSQKVPIRGGTNYYVGYIHPSRVFSGAFFNANGKFLSILRRDDCTEITPSRAGGENTYDPAQIVLSDEYVTVTLGGETTDKHDRNKELFPTSTFMTLYKFTAPEDASYVSINLMPTTDTNTGNTIHRYQSYIASKPMFIPNGTGNIVISETDAIYQKYKDKKLCVIGPSTVAIDRRYFNGYIPGPGDTDLVPAFVNPQQIYKDYYDYITNPAQKKNANSGYIAGYQEYLWPYFAEVKSFGFSGASMEKNRGNEGKASIFMAMCGDEDSEGEAIPEEFDYTETKNGVTNHYHYTITMTHDQAPDLSGYDVFYIEADGNGIRSAKKTPTEAEKEADLTGYMTALRAICDKILTDNPRAEIYLGLFNRITQYHIFELLNDEIRELAQELSCNLNDSTRNFNGVRNGMGSSYKDLTYDNKHRNNLGNRYSGYALRKTIMGF